VNRGKRQDPNRASSQTRQLLINEKNNSLGG
jgi:hypothetical protein